MPLSVCSALFYQTSPPYSRLCLSILSTYSLFPCLHYPLNEYLLNILHHLSPAVIQSRTHHTGDPTISGSSHHICSVLSPLVTHPLFLWRQMVGSPIKGHRALSKLSFNRCCDLAPPYAGKRPRTQMATHLSMAPLQALLMERHSLSF